MKSKADLSDERVSRGLSPVASPSRSFSRKSPSHSSPQRKSDLQSAAIVPESPLRPQEERFEVAATATTSLMSNPITKQIPTMLSIRRRHILKIGLLTFFVFVGLLLSPIWSVPDYDNHPRVPFDGVYVDHNDGITATKVDSRHIVSLSAVPVVNGDETVPPLTIFTSLPDVVGATDEPLDLRYRSNIMGILSWVALKVPAIIMFGSPTACKNFEFEVLSRRSSSVTNISCLIFECFAEEKAKADGAPTIDCLFSKAAKLSQTDLLMYSNSDIILFPDFLKATDFVASKVKSPFMVGKRRDMNVSSTLIDISTDGEWLGKLHSEAMQKSVGHVREGIDYMVFNRLQTPKVPPFLIGRIQWDNWIMLQAIVTPEITTVEISDVVLALHVNHGGYKSSHKKNGTEYNKQLAIYLPHPYVKETKVYHPGTIWLGRLDEVDLNLVSSDLKWQTRSEKYFETAIQPPRATCPKCHLVYNDQSGDLKLYLAHQMANERRTVALVRVSESQIQKAIDYRCFAAQHGVHSLLFTTTDVRVYTTLTKFGMTCHLFRKPYRTHEDHPLLQFIDFVGKALYDGYNVLIISLQLILVQPVGSLIKSEVDVMYDKQLKSRLLFLRSRGRTYRLSLKIAELLKQSFEKASIAPNSWKEDELLDNTLTKAIPAMDANSVPQVREFEAGCIQEYKGGWKRTTSGGWPFNLSQQYEPNTKLTCEIPEDKLDAAKVVIVA